MTQPTFTLEQALAIAAAMANAPQANPTPLKQVHNERPVLVTTEFRGVFFGYATETSGDTIHLKRARNCIYWSADTKGFLGLVSKGPTDGCRVGPPADIELRKITCVAECTAEAVKAWESAPWKK